MKIVYYSLMGNVKRFVQKLDLDTDDCIQLTNRNVKDGWMINEPYCLITNTLGFGNPPPMVVKFLELNHGYLKGVAASGNKNWGDNFARSADMIAEMYNVPVLHKFELSGVGTDVEIFKERVRTLKCDTLS